MEEERSKPSTCHTCDLCHYASKSGFVIHKHLVKHERLDTDCFHCKLNTPETYECDLCGFETEVKVSLSEHILVVHTRREISGVVSRTLECYKCKNCCFNTYSLLVLLKHNCHYLNQELPVTDAEATKVRYWKCQKCSYEAKKKSNLTRHVLNKHTRLEEIHWHKCHQCAYEAKEKKTLKYHIVNKHMHPDEIKWYKCNKCSYKAKQKEYLKRHALFKHVETKDVNWLECDNCSYKAKGKWTLERHIASNHKRPEEIKWYKCNKCSHKAKQKNNLKRHIACRHAETEDINWHECDKCSYKAKTNLHLKDHIKRMHNRPEG